MAIKSTTIVVNVTKNAMEHFSFAEAYDIIWQNLQDGTEDVYALLGKEVLEAGENYIITKANQKITVLFYHDGDSKEDIAEKITLTGLEPSSLFILEKYQLGEKKEITGKRRANSAGILETIFPVPAGSIVLLREE